MAEKTKKLPLTHQLIAFAIMLVVFVSVVALAYLLARDAGGFLRAVIYICATFGAPFLAGIAMIGYAKFIKEKG